MPGGGGVGRGEERSRKGEAEGGGSRVNARYLWAFLALIGVELK